MKHVKAVAGVDKPYSKNVDVLYGIPPDANDSNSNCCRQQFGLLSFASWQRRTIREPRSPDTNGPNPAPLTTAATMLLIVYLLFWQNNGPTPVVHFLSPERHES